MGLYEAKSLSASQLDAQLAPLNALSSRDQSLAISSHRATDLGHDDRSWVTDLFERNMQAMYEKSSSGYDRDEKYAELFDPDSRFLVVNVPSTKERAAYVIFRFDEEETAQDDELASVVYCYEVQVDSKWRGFGIGRHLMTCLESLGRLNCLQKVMLTVFKENTQAIRFYERIGFVIDEISPSKWGHEEDYEIMSKLCKP